MNDNKLIPVAIVSSLGLGILNVEYHFMPYSAPAVILVVFVGLCEVVAAFRKRFSKAS